LYADRCELCHGATGAPGAELPPGVHRPRDLSDPAVQRSIHDHDLIVVVRHGRKGMPALTPRVPESDGPPLAAFVRLFSPGFTLYSRYCANCHGDHGDGVRDLGEAIRLPTVAFDRKYFAKVDPEQLRKSIWHMLSEHKPIMPHYRWALSEAQARAVVEYLKSTAKSK
jgi:mono/diheme cytochrome c family protein